MKLDEIDAQKSNHITTGENIHRLIETLTYNEKILPEFNEDVWFAVVEKVVVYNDSSLIFHFKGGTELPWKI
ncbi:hypothetical protein [Caproiciproducens faecalis]|uniref:Uncharacterized protein n=1 Tax=Caproiciproducens faecalis TaxID=2820301 RepID=A0ABS7DJZ9_9FIRM|nr:hypothetical protein [Caproiciproducens faecalis]MBW7571629.1 hypothetical protein [Caproiciproducens faecalis]